MWGVISLYPRVPPRTWVTAEVVRRPGSGGGLSSTLTWRSPSCAAWNTLLSPTLNISRESARTRAPATVVPMVASSGRPSVAEYTARLQRLSASPTASGPSSVGPSEESWRTTSSLATSPAGWPPRPSATATTSGRPKGKTRVCGFWVTVPHRVHGPMTRLSSLCSRTSPT